MPHQLPDNVFFAVECSDVQGLQQREITDTESKVRKEQKYNPVRYFSVINTSFITLADNKLFGVVHLLCHTGLGLFGLALLNGCQLSYLARPPSTF